MDQPPAIGEMTTFDRLKGESIGGRATTGIVSLAALLFSGLAVVLSIVGTHGTLSAAVERRLRDWSVRAAL